MIFGGIKPYDLLRNRHSGRLLLVIGIEWFNNVITGEKQHVKVLNEDNKIIELGLRFIESEYEVIG